MTRGLTIAACLALVAVGNGCNDYGTKLDYDGSDVYYTKNVTEAEAKAVGDYLKGRGVFKDKKRSFRLDKDGDTYKFQIIVDEDYKSLNEYPEAFRITGARISHFALKDKPVAVVISSNRFKPFETLDAKSVGTMASFGKSEINYSTGISKEQAEKLSQFLQKVKFFTKESPATVQVRKAGEKTQVRFVIREDKIDDKLVRLRFRFFARGISKEIFDGKPVEVHFTDSHLKTVHVLGDGKKEEPGEKTEKTK